MNVLKLVDFTSLFALSRRLLLGCKHHIDITLACSIHEFVDWTSVQVCIGLEVVLPITFIKDGGHGTLTDTLSSLILSLIDLPLNLISVVVLNLFKPIE